MTTQPPPYGPQPTAYGPQPPPPAATPQQGFGAPEQGFGPPPQGFGPPQQGFGPPPPQGFGSPPHSAPSPYHAPPPPQPGAVGPEFMAVDRRNSIVVDAAGVAFEVNGVTAEFPWHEIRSVHYRPGPSGKHLMMGVVHLDGVFYECVVEAKPRARIQEWFTHLPAVLGHYRPMG